LALVRICEKIEWCTQKHFGLGYCQEHYKRLKAYGDPLHVPTAEEIGKKISKANTGNVPHNKGKKGVSKETSKKLSDSGKKRGPMSQKTKDKLSEAMTKPKKQCSYCGKKFADLEKHENRCKEHPDRKSQSLKDRNEKNKPKREHINKLAYAAQAENFKKNPNKKIKRDKQQHDYNQIPENKIRNNENRNISRPKRDKKIRDKLKKILGGEDCAECIQCGFKDHRALPNDHIDNDGYLDNRKFSDKRGRDYHYTTHPEEAKKKLQILCSNCNEIKKHNLSKEEWNLKHHSKSAERARKENSTRKQNAHQVLGGNICTICDFNDPRAMQIDHIHGGGRADRAQLGYQKWLQNIIDDPEKARNKLQILCVNCNIIKQNISDNGNCNCKKFHVDYFKNA
jgi:hypothetical protein